MNQENINTLTELIKVGDLVEIIYQLSPTYGLVIAKHLGHGDFDYMAKRRGMTFVTVATGSGIKKYPIFWCVIVDKNICKLDK
jgi:hypothetical protein